MIGRLLELRQAFEGKNDWEKAARTAGLTARLYPHSDVADTYYAISLLIVGRRDEARDSLKKAISLNPRGMASAGVLNQIALALIRIDKRDAAIEWLGLAAELYPKEAAFYGTLGDVHRDAARRDLAIEAYKKALELDQKFEHAKEMLKKLGGT